VTFNNSFDRMKATIDRLFAEAPKLADASGKPRNDQAPALECQLTLKAGLTLAGSLSTTPEGGLRLLSMNVNRETKEPVAIETFFDFSDVACISVARKVTIGDQPSLIHSPT
jgi:hypothetical protein